MASPNAWYPCPPCCKPGEEVSGPCEEFCTDGGPGYVCVEIAGVIDRVAPPNCLCDGNVNQVFWLQFVGPLIDGGNIDVGTDVQIAPPDEENNCAWRCAWNQHQDGFLCPETDSVLTLIVFEATDGNTYLRVILGDPFTAAVQTVWSLLLGPSRVVSVCRDTWDGLVLPYLEDTFGICDPSASTATITTRGVTVPDQLCCHSDHDGCFPGTAPRQMQMEIAGMAPCVTVPCPTCCNNCAAFNGTYLLTQTDDPGPSCYWTTEIDICQFTRIDVFGTGFIRFTGHPQGDVTANFALPSDCRWAGDVGTMNPFIGCTFQINVLTLPICDGSLRGIQRAIDFTFTAVPEPDCI